MDLDYIDNDNSIMERLRQKSRRIFGTGFKGYSGGSWDRLISNRGRGNMDEIEPIFHVRGHERRPAINVVSLRNLSWMNKEKKTVQTQSDKSNDESNESQDDYGIIKNQYYGRSS